MARNVLPKYKKLSGKYFKYAEDVLSGKIVAGLPIRLACQRYLDWFNRDDLFFDAKRVDKIMSFFPHMKHFEGDFNRQPFEIEGKPEMAWEYWVLCNIFGWYREDDHSKRVIRNVFLLISRKSGKSSLSAGIMLANMIVENEGGFEGYIVANTREQAKIAFKYVSGFARSLDPKHKHLKIARDWIEYDKTHSMIKVLSADSMNNDGYNPSTFIVDEFAAAKDYSNYNILKSGQAMRKNPLSITISSAGFLLDSYPCYEQCKVGMKVLHGEVKDDSTFYGIWQLDEGDDYRDPSVWQKACPSYPLVTQRDYMEERVNEAKVNMAKLVDVKTKNFNQWCAAADAWMDGKYLQANHHEIDLSQLKDEACWVGIDLSATRDLTALSVCFPPNPYRDYLPDKYIWKNYCWIPRAAVDDGPNSNVYRYFIENGYAQVTAGNSVDYDAVLSKLIELSRTHTVMKVCYDEWNAIYFTQKAQGEGLPMEPYAQGLASFNRPTKAFEILTLNQRCAYECTPLLNWMFSHCELKWDHVNNCKPIKAAENPLNKIDCIIAMLQALAGAMLDNILAGDATVMSVALTQDGFVDAPQINTEKD